MFIGNKSKRNILLLAFVTLCGCTKEPQKDYRVWLENEAVIRFDGKISYESVTALKSLYQTLNVKPSLMRINSSGGEGRAGLDMGEWVHQTGISVRVKKLCASSCANYVFLAAKVKYLDESAALVWHGGLNQENLFENMMLAVSGQYVHSTHEANIRINPKKSDSSHGTCPWDKGAVKSMPEEEIKKIYKTVIKECLAELSKREQEFFTMIGVDPNLPYYGQQGDYTHRYQSKQHKGFDYSLGDLEKMGVTNIVLKDEAWKPEMNKKHQKGKIYRVSI